METDMQIEVNQLREDFINLIIENIRSISNIAQENAIKNKDVSNKDEPKVDDHTQ